MTTSVDSGSTTTRGWIDEGVGIIQLNRPERSNALHVEMYDAVPRLIETYEADDAVGCILLCAAGRAFCAGGDVQAGVERSRRIAAGEESAEEPPGSEDGSLLAQQARMVTMLQASPKLSVAAINGPAVGAGVGIALSTDLRVFGEAGSLVTGWGKLAFSGDFGGTWFLQRMLGHARALELLISGERLAAQRCLELGLANRVVADDQLEAASLAWAKEIAAGPTKTYGLMKENLLDAAAMSLEEALPGESRRMRASGQSEEHREAVRSWLRAAREKKGG